MPEKLSSIFVVAGRCIFIPPILDVLPIIEHDAAGQLQQAAGIAQRPPPGLRSFLQRRRQAL